MSLNRSASGTQLEENKTFERIVTSNPDLRAIADEDSLAGIGTGDTLNQRQTRQCDKLPKPILPPVTEDNYFPRAAASREAQEKGFSVWKDYRKESLELTKQTKNELKKAC